MDTSIALQISTQFLLFWGIFGVFLACVFYAKRNIFD